MPAIFVWCVTASIQSLKPLPCPQTSITIPCENLLSLDRPYRFGTTYDISSRRGEHKVRPYGDIRAGVMKFSI